MSTLAHLNPFRTRFSRGLTASLALGIPLLVGALTAQSSAQQEGPDATAATWGDVKSIVYNRCVTCHSAPDPAADLDLWSPEAVRRAALEGSLLDRLNDADNPMPPSGLLPEEARELVALWAQAGAPIEEPVGSPNWARPDTHHTPRRQPEHHAVTPFDITTRGFEFLERMQGHWIGSMELMGQDIPWFAFDYRAVGHAHVHGIFEGGTMGNLLTSFFYARYKGVDTLMARNGGILNGIYRTSYFVLDRVEPRDGADAYRFVDALGGAGIMWMELTFRGDELDFQAYTSRMGEQPEPTRHMHFTATRRHSALAEAAARATGFPERRPEFEFPDGMPRPDWGEFGPATSASYMWQDHDLTYEEMGALAEDPVRIEDLPHLARLTVRVDRTPTTQRAKLHVYLSREPFTTSDGALRERFGYIREDIFDTVLLFPEITAKRDTFTFTYLHPGDYYLTVVADLDKDGIPGTNDAVSESQKITVAPGSHPEARVRSLSR